MTEGWFGDDYLILFEERAAALDPAYGLSKALPGYRLVGLRGWDDFLVEDSAGACFTVPTVPLVQEHLVPFTLPRLPANLESDAKVRGRIKWYVKPIAFGGDSQGADNITWITLEQHIQAVIWWNKKYHETRGSQDGKPAA